MTEYREGEKIQFSSQKALMVKALHLSAEGYGIGIIGYHDMYEHILTIMAVPEEKEGD